MSKQEMLRDGIDSPDVADALAMTFARPQVKPAYQQQQSGVVGDDIVVDPYETI